MYSLHLFWCMSSSLMLYYNEIKYILLVLGLGHFQPIRPYPLWVDTCYICFHFMKIDFRISTYNPNLLWLLLFAGAQLAEIIRYLYFLFTNGYACVCCTVVLITLALILQPQYEKVAKLFNGAKAVHPGIILMTRVDCANKVTLIIFIHSSFWKWSTRLMLLTGRLRSHHRINVI